MRVRRAKQAMAFDKVLIWVVECSISSKHFLHDSSDSIEIHVCKIQLALLLELVEKSFTSSLSSSLFLRPLKFEKSIHNYPRFSNIKLCFTDKHFHDETFVWRNPISSPCSRILNWFKSKVTKFNGSFTRVCRESFAEDLLKHLYP